MIIDDRASSREFLVRIIRHENLEPESFPDRASAGHALREDPDGFILVIARLRLPEGSALELLRQGDSGQTTSPPFIFTAGPVSRQEIIQAFRHGAFDLFQEPLNPREISAALARARRKAEKRAKRRNVYHYLREKILDFEIGNQLELVQPLVEVLTSEIETLNRLSGHRLTGLGVGLHELLVNAIEHGNLEIPSTLKERPDYLHYLRRRAQTLPFRERRVTLYARITPESFSCTIRDQGPGFDWRNLPHPGNPENLIKAHGRGITMAGSFFDEFIFNESGNEITVKKALS